MPGWTPTCAPTWPPERGTGTSRPVRSRASNNCGRRSRPASTSCCAGSGPTEPSVGRSIRPASWRSTPSSPVRRRSITASAAPSPAPSAWGRSDPTGSWPPAGWPMPWPISPTPSRPRSSSPWTGTTRCCPGALSGEAARRRMAGSWDTFVMEGRGVRCVSTGEWVTAAETAECVLALDALGMDEMALRLLSWVQTLAQRGRLLLDGHGLSRRGDLPSAGAVVLHRRRHGAGRRRPQPDTPASGIFRGEGLPSHLDLTEPAPDAPAEPAMRAPGKPGPN